MPLFHKTDAVIGNGGCNPTYTCPPEYSGMEMASLFQKANTIASSILRPEWEFKQSNLPEQLFFMGGGTSLFAKISLVSVGSHTSALDTLFYLTRPVVKVLVVVIEASNTRNMMRTS
eukprot:scaffold2133_cov86-Cylindrotheca_fusiformis.AAC.2